MSSAKMSAFLSREGCVTILAATFAPHLGFHSYGIIALQVEYDNYISTPRNTLPDSNK